MFVTNQIKLQRPRCSFQTKKYTNPKKNLKQTFYLEDIIAPHFSEANAELHNFKDDIKKRNIISERK